VKETTTQQSEIYYPSPPVALKLPGVACVRHDHRSNTETIVYQSGRKEVRALKTSQPTTPEPRKSPRAILAEIESRLAPRQRLAVLKAQIERSKLPTLPPGGFWRESDLDDKLDKAIRRPDNWRELQQERLRARNAALKAEMADLKARWAKLHRPRWIA
jgi:hypothetical protein